MMKRFLFGVLFSLWTSLAAAGVNCTMPFTFVPGTLADANQVNANFAAAVACFLNAAGAGNNNDITALLALTTPLSTAQGGSSIYIGGTSTGSANAQVIAAPSPTGFALTRGLSILFTAGFTNTGATQINVNGTGLVNLFRQSPSGPQALTGGEVVLNDLTWAIYDGVQFQLVNSGAQYGGFGPLTSLSSAAPDLGTIASHNITFTGNTTITSFGSSASTTFPLYRLNFSTVLVLTHNGTSLILPSAVNITTASGDNAEALYLGSGNWQVISYQRGVGTSVVSPTPLCGFSGLNVNNGASNSVINWSFNNSVLINPTGNVPVFSTAKSGSINITTGTGGTSTAGGMDGTGPGNNTFTYMYAIYNGTTWSAVGSVTTPATGPVMPAGYTFLCYMGAIKTNGAGNLYGTRILGNEARYVVGGANVTQLPVVVNGVTGTTCTATTPTYAAEAISGSTGAAPLWVPSTAVAVDLLANSQFSGADSAAVLVAPSGPTTYNGFPVSAANTNPPPLYALTTSNPSFGRLLLESASIYVCISSASGAVHAYGWKDAVNAN